MLKKQFPQFAGQYDTPVGKIYQFNIVQTEA